LVSVKSFDPCSQGSFFKINLENIKTFRIFVFQNRLLWLVAVENLNPNLKNKNMWFIFGILLGFFIGKNFDKIKDLIL